MSKNLLDIRGLKTYFFTESQIVKAVDCVNLEIKRGEVVGLVGESGCGKTVTTFSIMRMVPPPGKIVEGNILFGDKNLLELTEEDMRHVRGKEISMVFQDPMTYLNPTMTVEKQIGEAFSLHEGGSKAQVKRKVIEMLKAVGMPAPEKVVNYYPHQLSGGMKQRVLIAIATSCHPSLLIADEPTTALDVTIQAQVLKLLKELCEVNNTSILLITHDLGVISEICDKVYVMYAAKILEYGDIFEIFENPLHPYTRGLYNSALSLDEFKKDLVAIGGTVPNLANPPKGCRFHPRCDRAINICREREPPLIEENLEHGVSCWLYT